MNKKIPSLENKSARLKDKKPSLSDDHRMPIGTNKVSDAIASEHWEFLLGELVHFIGLFIMQSINEIGFRTTEVLFDQMVKHLEILKKMPGNDGCVLIRRTHYKIPTPPQDENYFAMLGNLILRGNDGASAIQDDSNKKSTHLRGALSQAFKCFSDQGIDSLYVKIPGESAKEIDQLRLALNIIARFKTAVDDASSIRFRCYGRALTFSVIHDANGQPDVNLTLTAAVNGLSPINARALVKQAEAFHTLKMAEKEKADPQEEYIGSYNQIFGVRSLRSQIIRPLVEVNNLPWLEVNSMVANDPDYQLNKLSEIHPEISKNTESEENKDIAADQIIPLIELKEDASKQLQEMISKYISIEDDKNKEAIDVLMADDYGELEPLAIGERFVSLTHLLYVLDSRCQDPVVLERVVDFYRYRLKDIQDTILSNILVQRQGLKIVSEERSVIVGLVHPRLFDLITLLTENVTACRRMAIIKDIAFNFDPRHMAGLAAAFGLSEKDAHHILEILKDCFSGRGSFIRPTFEGRINLMTEFGNAIFEILWCFLKETPRRQDRLDFLNALQLLMARLSNPKRATQFLLADICQVPESVEFTDRNAFSLANILLHKENKELYVDINRTPESVLTLGRKINIKVRRYALWRLDADRVRMLTKLRTIHHLLEDTLRIAPGEPRSFEISFLMALEREAIIFMALVGGLTSRIFLRELLEQYGTPDSDIYHHGPTKIYLPEIMVQLQILVHSIGRAGNTEDVEKLETLRENNQAFYKLDSHPAHQLKVKQLMKCIPQTLKMIQ